MVHLVLQRLIMEGGNAREGKSKANRGNYLHNSNQIRDREMNEYMYSINI